MFTANKSLIWRSTSFRAGLAGALTAFLVLYASSTATVAKPTTQPAAATRPATTAPAETPCDRLTDIHKATLAALEYAKAHNHQIPTTEQLAKQMGVALKDFRYVVIPKGSLDDHKKWVKGGWPEVLIGEKHGGADGKWAFGFVDGLATLQTIASYKEMENSAALNAIPQSGDHH